MVQPLTSPAVHMLSAIIATRESERTLVPTLSALVPGAVAGLLSEVVVADAGSRDATAEVADVAGCRIMVSVAPLGTRLKVAAESTHSPWLLFLRAGCVPEPGWTGAAQRFIEATEQIKGARRAAVFRPAGIADLLRPGLAEIVDLVRVTFGGGAKPEHGLLIARRFYDALGGHPAHEAADAALLRRLGRRRIAMLSTGASAAR